jgi:hypothetical protein
MKNSSYERCASSDCRHIEHFSRAIFFSTENQRIERDDVSHGKECDEAAANLCSDG